MEQAGQAIYTALRDDSEATNGIRALLGNTTTTPYNVYHADFPTSFDFSPSSGTAQGLITYHMVSSVRDNEMSRPSIYVFQALYNITVYARALTKVEAVHRRVMLRLHNMRNVTVPTTLAWLHNVKLENEGPNIFDDAFKVHYRAAFYRVWGRDDNING